VSQRLAASYPRGTRNIRIDWLGTCHRCGLCCTIETPAGRLVCEHLRAELSAGVATPLGTPEASRCGVYSQRVNGMPIRLRDAYGVVRMTAQCGKDSADEDAAILPHVGRGCSLTVQTCIGQLVAFTPDPRPREV
jgi:hypothetical protein